MLSELPHVGERTARAILWRCAQRGHGLAAFFHLPAQVLRRDFVLPEAALRCLDQHLEAHRRRCEWLSAQLLACGGAAWTLLDPDYPERLRRWSHAPPIIFTAGTPCALERSTLALLHSRTPTEQTVALVSLVVERAARAGFAVVTSNGKAAYRLVGVASRALSARRIVVLDRGLFSALGPSLARDPCTNAAPNEGVFRTDLQWICSPFRLLDHAVPRNGRRRDAIVGALADVILALHARPGGEIERVCLEALDEGRPVLSWHGENPALVAAGAVPVGENDLNCLGRFAPGSP
ncbi:MAG: hypothetical protein KatS3mg077_1953 [Candidatus Binatia bacterium]|nr:MAG: hypothetical protein KatS3mg077_1953 [Candidatus Binatia bacterium]